MLSKTPDKISRHAGRSAGASEFPRLSAEFLHPGRVVLVGASNEAGSIGQALLINLSRGAGRFELHAVNPHPIEVPGGSWHSSLADLPEGSGLGVIAVPARFVPDAVGTLGKKGIRAAVVISAGLGGGTEHGAAMLQAARDADVRLLGPNCLGLMLPHAGINASFAAIDPRPGKFALLSQSGAIVTSVLEWAEAEEIGFSAVLSVGDMAQTGLGELVDLLSEDERTEAILIYVEGLKQGARFLDAARKASRKKPIIALKAGRSAAAGRAALSHTGALAGSGEVYQAALAEAGIVQVDNLSQFYGAAKILQHAPRARGNRLAILTNGGGAGILAVDALANTPAELAELKPETIDRLGECLPGAWSHANPVDIIGDAGPRRYRDSLSALLADESCDAVLVMNCPTGVLAPGDAAAAVAEAVAAARADGCAKPVIGCWLGPANLRAAEPSMREAGIPCFATPDEAVRAIGVLIRLPTADAPEAGGGRGSGTTGEVSQAREIIAGAMKEERRLLTEVEGKDLLRCFGIPVVPTRLVRTVGEVAQHCDELDAPFVVKIVSPDIVHKSDVGGVAVGLADAREATAAAQAMLDRIGRVLPDAHIEGFALQSMIERSGAKELFAGLATDPTFGPVILFGAGGTAIEVIDDKAIALPPVSPEDAQAMIARTRIFRLLKGYRNVPAADVNAVAKVLQALSAIAETLPEIGEIDINPLLVDEDGVVALDARVVLSR